MQTFYRFSERSYVKTKLCDKRFCIENYLKVFAGVKTTVLADFVCDETFEWLQSLPVEVIRGECGNAKSFRWALSEVFKLPHSEVVYLLEDDYVHNPAVDCVRLLQEGLQYGDYCTAFCHPDKFLPGNRETSEIFKGEFFWYHSRSTTMTFCTTVAKLGEDLDVWWSHTEHQHPNDHLAFLELGQKGRKLAVNIPGAAWHTDDTLFKQTGLAHDRWAQDLVTRC